MRCGECQYFTTVLSKNSAMRPEDGTGECRRHAPRGPVALGWVQRAKDGEHHAAIISAFPFVPDDDWCGEFLARKQ
jgi:hypothetical protein